MNKLLKDPKKRRQLLIAGSAVAVLIVLLVLHKKSSPAATTTEESAAKPTTEPLNLPAGESGGSGGGSPGTGNNPPAGGGGIANGEGATIAGAIQTSAAESAASQLETQQDLNALANALSRGSEAGPAPSGPPPTASHTGTPLKGVTKNAEAGNPRAGDSYVATNYKGKPVHAYVTAAGKPKAIPHGVGPHKNLVVLPHKAAPKKTPTPAIKNTSAGNPRKGQEYKETTYRGKKAHEYKHSVPHGVGPKKNLIIT